MVISAPSTKHTVIGRPILRDLLISMPMPSPMGIMDRSTPSVNSPMPSTSSSAPNRNMTIVPGSSGATVTHSSRTTAVMGSTDDSDS